MHFCRLAFALAVTSAAIRAHAELPSEADPPPFSGITLPDSSPTTAEVPPSNPPSPARPYGPFATVNDLGDPESIEFRGLTQVRVEDIRWALQWDPKFQAAARPSNSTADFLTVLESRLLDGFQSSGFVDAKVSVTTDFAAKRFVVTVTEGQRFRQGKVVVTGDERVDAQQLVEWLTNEQKLRTWTIRYADSAPSNLPADGVTLWTPGENLNCTPKNRETLEAGVRMALLEQGFPFASFDLKNVPAAEPGLADLHVNLLHVGKSSTIKEIEVEGLDRDTREQLLDYLEISPGQRLEAKLLDKIQAKLADSCRYWSHKLKVDCGPKPDGRDVPADESVNLKLELEEFSHTPSLSEPLSEVDEVLRKTSTWINNYPSKDSPDLVVETTRGEESDSRNHFTTLRLAAAVDGRVADSLSGRPYGWSFEHTVFLNPQGLEVIDCGAHQKFGISVPNLTTLSLKISADRHEDGSYAQNLFAGWNASTKGKSAESGNAIWTVRAVPVAVVYAAHRPDSTATIENSILTIKSPDSDIEIDANTGALIRITVRNDEDQSETTVRMVPGGYDTLAKPLRDRFESFPNRYDSQQPISTLLKFIVEQLQQQPLVESHDAPAKILEAARLAQESNTIRQLLSQLDEAWLEKQAGQSATNAAAPKFFLTTTAAGEDDTIQQLIKVNVIYHVPGLADRLFPRGSWPWTLTREAAFLFLANGTADESKQYWNRMVNELARLERAEELGPLASCCWIGLTCRGKPNRYFDTLGTRVAQCGLRQSTEENIRRDIELFVTGDNGWAKLFRKLLDDFAELPEVEQRQLMALLPAGCATPLIAHAERRASQPEQPAVDALRDELLNLWKSGLREQVEEQLRAHTAEVALKPIAPTQPARK